MTDSILNSIKKLLGILPDDTEFDQDIIIHINSVFMILNQLGVGTTDVFEINDAKTEWASFVAEENTLSLLKSYMYAKVRLMFDPPQTAMLVSAIERLINEYEYRLLVQVDQLNN